MHTDRVWRNLLVIYAVPNLTLQVSGFFVLATGCAHDYSTLLSPLKL